MKIILFDLGDTLEHQVGTTHALIPGAVELLSAVQDMLDRNGDRPALALVSDFNDSAETYFELLRNLTIDSFFSPLAERVTLSNEVGVTKPDEKIFRVAINKIHNELPFQNVLFVTENKDHIIQARKFGMMTIRIRRGEKEDGEVNSLIEMIPLIHLFVLT
ncbi:MAG: hypothetical protein WB511_03140 [Nitrososphaeraceae archaeon]